MVGIGAELNGDDGVGILTVRKLKRKLGERQNVLVREGGSLPESLSSPLRRFAPDLVLLLDAADLDESQGTIALLQPDQIATAGFSTHAMPLSLLATYLKQEIDCEVVLIGIQPQNIEFGASMSAACVKAAGLLAGELSKWL